MENRYAQLIFTFGEAVDIIAKERRSRFSGFTGRQLMFIRQVASFDEVPTVKMIAASLNASRPNASTIVSDLERRGILFLYPDANDGRLTRVSLTAAGQDAADVANEWFEGLVSDFSILARAEDLDAFQRVLIAYTQAIENKIKKSDSY